jgi:hypothetical protein
MELMLLIPEGKPPFIAIAFAQPGEAGLLNSDIITSPLLKRPCKLVIEIYLKDQINLSLICEDLVTARFYPHIKCNTEKLNSWLFITRNCKKFKFAHLSTSNGQFKIPNAGKSTKKFALDVNSIELLGEKEIKENNVKTKWFSNNNWDLLM